jgi:diguanylate cyclase (GGDEF)-like protein
MTGEAPEAAARAAAAAAGSRRTDQSAAIRRTLRGPGEAFWVNHIRASTVLYGLCNIAVWVYLGLTHAKSHRPAILAVAVFGLAAAIVMDRCRHRIARGSHHLTVLYAWSSLTYGFVALISYLDGGASSPLVLLLFIALSYTSLAYPPHAVLAFSALAVAVYLGLATVAAAGPAAVQLSASMIGLSGVLGAFAAANQRRQRIALAELAGQLEQQATVDQLTGCLNRRTFHDHLSADLERASRLGQPVSLLFVDIDHFKTINDTYGHLAGDEVLETIGDVLVGSTWIAGVAAGRIGGDEFAVILPGADGTTAHDIGRRIHDSVAGRPLAIPVPVSVSVGIGCFPTPATTLEALCDAADRSLYSVKWAGRDGVASTSPEHAA